MALSFWVVNSFRSIQVMSANTVLDVEVVTCQTVPHGLTFTYAVPLDSWAPSGGPSAANGLLDVIAVTLEELAAGNHVVASSPTQDIDINGLLTDTVDLTVAYDRTSRQLPTLYGTVSVPILNFFQTETGIGGFKLPGVLSPAEIVDAEYQRLTSVPPG